jgi:hypothetical protein
MFDTYPLLTTFEKPVTNDIPISQAPFENEYLPTPFHYLFRISSSPRSG